MATAASDPPATGVAGAVAGYTDAMTSATATEPLATDDPRKARRVLAGQLAAWGLTRLADDVELVISELVMNAVEHAGGVRSIALTARDGRVLVEVGDDDPTSPTPMTVDPAQPRGRGLLLVAAVSQDWGVRPRDGGKVVWAELRADAGDALTDGGESGGRPRQSGQAAAGGGTSRPA